MSLETIRQLALAAFRLMLYFCSIEVQLVFSRVQFLSIAIELSSSRAPEVSCDRELLWLIVVVVRRRRSEGARRPGYTLLLERDWQHQWSFLVVRQ